MKRVLFCMLAMLVLTGMGGFGGDENKLPKASENYEMKVTDREGYAVQLTQVTVAENAYVSGTAGRGTHVVGFDSVRKADFGPVSGHHVNVTVHLKDGGKLELAVDGRKRLKGQSRYGVFSIQLSDIREIDVIKRIQN